MLFYYTKNKESEEQNMKVELNKVFTANKGNRTVKWKVIEHPYFDELTLVKDYSGLYGRMKNGVCKEDYNHVNGYTTLETAYNDAYIMS